MSSNRDLGFCFVCQSVVEASDLELVRVTEEMKTDLEYEIPLVEGRIEAVARRYSVTGTTSDLALMQTLRNRLISMRLILGADEAQACGFCRTDPRASAPVRLTRKGRALLELGRAAKSLSSSSNLKGPDSDE
jgi:hypothetical protein